MDLISRERRSWNMSRIKSKNTKPELIVRSLLHRLGYRFRIHKKDLPGNPDIVLPKYKTIILVHGCYWHRHKGCKFAYKPKTNISFWEKKFNDNVQRDQKNQQLLISLGWKVHIIWECEAKEDERLFFTLSNILEQLE